VSWSPAQCPPVLGQTNVHIWRTRLDLDTDQIRSCDSLLTAEEHERARRFVFDEHRNRFVVARGTLRKLLAAYVDIPAAELEFAYGEHGKPRLVNPDTDMTFNVSHSGGRMLLAFARGRHVGIDVERTTRTVDWKAVAGRFFSVHEQAALAGLPEAARRAAFFRCWTRKEAFMKASGQGVAYGLTRFAVALAPSQAPELLWLAQGTPEDWGLADVEPDAEHIGAVCAERRDWQPIYLTG
jgi:4'-phosphopantetheinyl transferase